MRRCLLGGMDISAVWVDDCGGDGLGLLISLLSGKLEALCFADIVLLEALIGLLVLSYEHA